MSSFAWPAHWPVIECGVFLQPNQREFVSQYTGDYDSVDLLGERFIMNVRLGVADHIEGAEREAYFNRLLSAHRISSWHLARPTPNGTQRGVPTLSSAMTQGSNVFAIAGGTSGATFLPGDMVGLGGQLFQIAEAVTVSGGGTATITTVNRARALIASATALLWDKPVADWRLLNNPMINFKSAITDELDLEMMQVW